MRKFFENDQKPMNEVELLFYKSVLIQLYLSVFIFGAVVLLALSYCGAL